MKIIHRNFPPPSSTARIKMSHTAKNVFDIIKKSWMGKKQTVHKLQPLSVPIKEENLAVSILKFDLLGSRRQLPL